VVNFNKTVQQVSVKAEALECNVILTVALASSHHHEATAVRGTVQLLFAAGFVIVTGSMCTCNC
jgi:hypothetical protein